MSTELLSMPVLGRPESWRFPRLDRVALATGLTVLTCHLPGKQLLTASLLLDAGWAGETAEDAGVAAAAAAALSEGTTVHDANGFAAALDQAGAAFGAAAGSGGLIAEVQVPSVGFSAGLSLLAEAVSQPAFAASAVRRVLANQADQLVSGLAAPGTRGEWELRRLVFASSERSSLPAIGTTTSLMSLSQEAVATFYNSHAGSASSTLVVVGDLSSTNVLATVEQAFGSWIGRSGGRRSLAAPRAAARSSQTLVNRPGAAQTQVNLGVLAPGSGDADWAALTVACHVLGGGTVTSRLMSSLREDKGFTYGVFAQMAPEGARSLFKVSGSFATPVTGAAVAELLRVVAHAVDEGLTVEEVHGAASYLSGVFPLSMQTTQSVAHHVLKLLASDLPVDWTDKHLNALAAVDAEAASDALRRHIRPDAMSLAFVGDADAIAGDLAGAGIQPTSVQS